MVGCHTCQILLFLILIIMSDELFDLWCKGTKKKKKMVTIGGLAS